MEENSYGRKRKSSIPYASLYCILDFDMIINFKVV